jgi:hypothetical protein
MPGSRLDRSAFDWSTAADSQYTNNVKWRGAGYQEARKFLSAEVGLVPGVSAIQGLSQAITGCDYITGDSVDGWGRAGGALAAAGPLLHGIGAAASIVSDLGESGAELARFRSGLGLSEASALRNTPTLARLEAGGQVFYGISGGKDIALRVNIISKSHAEADVFNQAFKAGIRDGRAVLTVDSELCRACGVNGGVKSMAKQLGLSAITVIAPGTSVTHLLK